MATLPQIVKWHRSARPVDAVVLVSSSSSSSSCCFLQESAEGTYRSCDVICHYRYGHVHFPIRLAPAQRTWERDCPSRFRLELITGVYNNSPPLLFLCAQCFPFPSRTSSFA